MQLTLCPLMEPPKLMEMPRRCGGKRIIDYGDKRKGRDSPDARIVCTKCGARFPMDSKEGI